MNFYRLAESVDLKEIGKYPQMGEMIGGLNIDDPRHLLKQLSFESIPSFKLRKIAKPTDVISSRINADFIVSERIISIVNSSGSIDFQIAPITIIYKEIPFQYFLLRPIRAAFECLDYEQTEIAIMETTWDEKRRLEVEDVFEFQNLIKDTQWPESIRIKELFFRKDCALDIFALSHVYGGSGIFVSEGLKEKMIKAKITGIRFMNPNER
jgi:hypothetical protein